MMGLLITFLSKAITNLIQRTINELLIITINLMIYLLWLR